MSDETSGRAPLAGTTQAEAVAAVRAVLSHSLRDARLEAVRDDELLLRSGIVTSLEAVTLVAALESHFGTRLRDSALGAALLSLDSLASTLRGGDGAAVIEPPPPVSRIGASLRRAAQRPILLGAVALGAFMLLNLLILVLMQGALRDDYMRFLEGGKRLYPHSGAFSQDDFAFAFRFHEIQRPASPGEATVLFLGDSGTVGSFLDADETVPAALQAELRARGRAVRVLNLAWFGRFLPKDLMLLELAWDAPTDVVVLTVSDQYFSRKRAIADWITAPHCTLNVPLFTRFVERVPAEERAPFVAVEKALRDADDARHGGLRRVALRALPMLHYRPYMRSLVELRMAPGWLPSGLRVEAEGVRERRFALEDAEHVMPPPLTAADVDEDQVRMLESLIRLLERRGVRTVLFLEPRAPQEWRTSSTVEGLASDVAHGIATSTGCRVVDATWELSAPDFLDSLAHWTPEASRRLAGRLAEGFPEEGAP